MARWHRTTVTDGIDQASRLPRPLHDRYFDVDERDFPTLLATVADLAEHLTFVDLTNTPRGSWGTLLAAEDTCTLARILAFRPDLHERAFQSALERDPVAAIGAVLDLAALVDGWDSALRMPKTPAGAEFARRLKELKRSKLEASVARALALAGAAGLPTDPRFDATRATPSALDYARVPQPPLTNGGPRATLRLAFYDILNGIRFLQAQAPTFFKETLERADHEPASALIYAFLDLFGRVQEKLNGFTSRHTTFYYQDVIGAVPRPPGGDQVLLNFPEVTSSAALPVRAGTGVLAILPGGAGRRRFITDSDAVASNAQVAGLYTLFFERDPLLSPQRELDFVTRIQTADLALDDQDEEASPTSLLGGGRAQSMHAGLGLCISSPTLLLREGQRQVRLSLGFRETTSAGPIDPEDWGDRVLAPDYQADLRRTLTARILSDPGLTSGIGRENIGPTIDRLLAKTPVAALLPTELDETTLPEDPVQVVILRRLMAAADPERLRSFTAPFGRLVGRLLLAPDRQIHPALVDEIVEIARDLAGSGPGDRPSIDPDEVRRLMEDSHAYQYEKFLKDAFTLDVTTEEGWYPIGGFAVAPNTASGQFGLTFLFSLGPEDPAVLPSSSASAEIGREPIAPMARLLLAEGATLCAFSLLEPFVLDEVRIEVMAEGVRQLRVSNDLGPLDANQPFQPFGPVPQLGNSLIVGAYEAALKTVDTLQLRLVWAGLPRDFGGFPSYYEGYGTAASGYDFGVEPTWLVGGDWEEPATSRKPLALFNTPNAAEKLNPRTTLVLDAPQLIRPLLPSMAEGQYSYGLNARTGFLRLTLTGPAEAFGHGVYPTLYARNVSRLLSRRREPPSLNPPYTPTLQRMELDYAASTKIRVNGVPEEIAQRRGEFLVHLWPFGVEEIHPLSIRQEPGSLPPRWTDGALHIGLVKLRPGQPVTLVFHMAERARRRRSFEPPPLRWSYKTETGWKPLPPTKILADTTSGLMRSGIFTLSIPDDARVTDTGMPSAALWLRVGADAELEAFPRLARLFLNGVSAREEKGSETPLPAGVEWRLENGVAGLEVLRSVGQPIRGTPAETVTDFRARVSERLRHRDRAITTWDYERLTLERFPEVWKVKCLPVTDDRHPSKAAPGDVLVIVVPQQGTSDDELPFEPRMFDVLSLQRIQKELARVAPDAARIEVRNPSYDLIQVRCRVRIADDSDKGLMLRRLAFDVSQYLSPWTRIGPPSGFGWQFRAEDVQAYIADRPAVQSVSEFAMLMIASRDSARPGGETERVHRLIDTARPLADLKEGDGHDNVLSYSVPWTLPLPLKRQALRAEDMRGVPDAPAAGVGDLAVGSTLVVPGR